MPGPKLQAPATGRRRGRGSLLLANERTFLAHVRTGVAVMAFGFVVARFALFLAELSARGGAPAGPGLDVLIGAAITALGAGVVLFGAVRYARRREAIARGRAVTSPAWDIGLAALVGAGGVGLALYLAVRGLLA
jgi:putative membrane protein